MQDRVSVNPGRVLITPESGEPYYATLERADNPSVVGTPLNKANLLSDASAALYGLTNTAVPNDMWAAALDIIPKIKFDNFYESTNTIKSSPTNLSTARMYLAGASAGEYGILGGGYTTGSLRTDSVEAYNANLVRSTATSLSSAKSQLAGASAGEFGLIAGGETSSSVYSSTVDAYSPSLVKTSAPSLNQSRNRLVGVTFGEYALFGGGNSGAASSVVDAYDSDLVKHGISSLSSGRPDLAAAVAGNYVIFAGGYASGGQVYEQIVDAYNQDFIRSLPDELSVGRSVLSGASVGEYALIAGGEYGSTSYSDVDTYNSSLVHATTGTLSLRRGRMASASTENHAMFAGGLRQGSSNRWNNLDSYSKDLVNTWSTSTFALNESSCDLGSAKAGIYVVFAGGEMSNNNATASTTAYRDGYIASITVPAFSKHTLNRESEILVLEDTVVSINGAETGISGYIKLSGFTISGQSGQN